jgi:hypothetical protein
MTELEYKRWKSFSLRMAHRAFSLRLRKSRRALAWFVKDFFRLLDSDYFQINERLPVAWDSKWGMDNNHHLRSEEFLRDRIVSWDNTEEHPTWRDNYNHSTCGPFICDIVSMRMEQWNPFYWGDDHRYKRWDELWGDRIRCCLRAGIDMAVSPSAGVLGFTAGDLRRMYRGKVPDWVFGNEPLEVQTFNGVIPGIGLIPGETKLNGTFDTVPDNQGIWL